MTQASPQYASIWSDLMGVSFSQGYLDAGGVRTRYLAAGDTSKPTLLFLHGVGGHAEAYTRNLAAHAKHFRTIAIDLFGHGLTDYATGDAEIPVYLAHLKAVLDALGAESCMLSGESLGGWIAAKFALAHPERVSRLVLNTPGGSHSNPETLGRLRKLSMAAVEDPSYEAVRARLEFLMHDKSHVHDDLVAARRRVYDTEGRRRSILFTTVLMDPEIRERNRLTDAEFSAIRTPTLVLWTSDDPMADANEGKRVARLIPGAQFVVMEGCGHWPQFEDADVFNDVHIRFLLGEAIDDMLTSPAE